MCRGQTGLFSTPSLSKPPKYSKHSLLPLLSARIMGMRQHAWFYAILGIELGASCALSQHFTNPATSSALRGRGGVCEITVDRVFSQAFFLFLGVPFSSKVTLSSPEKHEHCRLNGGVQFKPGSRALSAESSCPLDLCL